MLKNELIPSEFEEQKAFVEWLEIMKNKGVIKVFSAVPNNTFTKSWSQKRKQVAEGVRAGVPDLIVVTENYTHFIEMKRKKGGVISSYQREWIEALQGTKVTATVCFGTTEAIKRIEENL